MNNNGISYTTVAQAKNQTTVRIMPINDISPVDKTTPNNDNYPLNRTVFLAVPNQTSLAVKNFLECLINQRSITCTTGRFYTFKINAVSFLCSLLPKKLIGYIMN
ncbi:MULTISPECIES: hypothetical protein [unclassified Okeania]|uniref:hypothetical protein n=1 Tax=unclassified Okeania TaxID=2634635 RepID=UPI00257E5D8E|nr:MULTISPECIES: hypothetical protein [unclassified Okeania]